jgi:hypothetical protein
MNLVAMAFELDAYRARLIPLLFVPLDSQILQHPELLTYDDRRKHSIPNRASYQDIQTESIYRAIQTILSDRAAALTVRHRRPFAPIYFDLIWCERYKNWGSNIWEIIPPRWRTGRSNTRCESLAN